MHEIPGPFLPTLAIELILPNVVGWYIAHINKGGAEGDFVVLGDKLFIKAKGGHIDLWSEILRRMLISLQCDSFTNERE